MGSKEKDDRPAQDKLSAKLYEKELERLNIYWSNFRNG